MGRKRTGSKTQREKPVIAGIVNEELMQNLQDIASQLGIQVRHEKGDFRSAGCRVEEKKLIILKKTDAAETKILTLMSELAKLDFEKLDIPPAIHDRLRLMRIQTVEENSVV